jgi:hypothetical protein
MANKAEISWKRVTEDGQRLEVYAHHVGPRWIFYCRERRVGLYAEVEEPPLDDWLKLLDAVRRRIQRRKLRPEEEQRVEASIRQRFPEAKL